MAAFTESFRLVARGSFHKLFNLLVAAAQIASLLGFGHHLLDFLRGGDRRGLFGRGFCLGLFRPGRFRLLRFGIGFVGTFGIWLRNHRSDVS